MRHLDLFSGIGGFALAAQWAFGKEYENVGFCEIDPFCQQVLKKNFPNCKIYGDIKTLTGIGPVDLITGGFPCQPFSNLGKRRGENDDRFLWPEMLRVIKECRPSWVVGENVVGIVSLALDKVCADLEAEGYAVEAFIIPAAGVGAPHKRERVWIVAYADFGRTRRHEPPGASEGTASCGRFSWDEDWRSSAAALCGMDDGLSAELDGLKLSKSGHRTKRLEALGNSIVPQVAYEILKTIKML